MGYLVLLCVLLDGMWLFLSMGTFNILLLTGNCIHIKELFLVWDYQSAVL